MFHLLSKQLLLLVRGSVGTGVLAAWSLIRLSIQLQVVVQVVLQHPCLLQATPQSHCTQKRVHKYWQVWR